jgi:hypothetical protein
MNDTAYEKKFSDFIRLLAESKEQQIMIHHPQVLGDDYQEIVESLDRLSLAGKSLMIVPKKDRG